jgi:hypothetical protein
MGFSSEQWISQPSCRRVNNGNDTQAASRLHCAAQIPARSSANAECDPGGNGQKRLGAVPQFVEQLHRDWEPAGRSVLVGRVRVIFLLPLLRRWPGHAGQDGETGGVRRSGPASLVVVPVMAKPVCPSATGLVTSQSGCLASLRSKPQRRSLGACEKHPFPVRDLPIAASRRHGFCRSPHLSLRPNDPWSRSRRTEMRSRTRPTNRPSKGMRG